MGVEGKTIDGWLGHERVLRFPVTAEAFTSAVVHVVEEITDRSIKAERAADGAET